MTQIYIKAHHQYLTDHSVTDQELRAKLREQFSYSARRMSRLTLLALLSGLTFTPPKKSGVYLASSFGSPSTMHELMMRTYKEQSAQPFNFINSIHNSSSFHVAKELAVDGPNLFMSVAEKAISWTKPILLAMGDLRSGRADSALLGWIHEHKKNAEPSTKEGAHFILLSKDPANATHMVTLQTGEPKRNDFSDQYEAYYYEEIEQLLNLLSGNSIDKISLPTALPQKCLVVEIL